MVSLSVSLSLVFVVLVVVGGGGGGEMSAVEPSLVAAMPSPRRDGRGGGAGVSDFGLIVDDGRLYVLGGRRYNGGLYEATNEVKRVELMVVCNEGRALRASDWHPHARLPRPSLVSVCGLLNIPSEL